MCCLGENVAGKPTQFMWERAIGAGRLDWRAITIQLAAQDLAVALAGMYVMRIMGLRFYFSLQVEALRQLAADQERLQFIGRITSAVRGPDAWQAWHNWGGTFLAWCAQQADLKQATCWLHGDSVECRSLWVALLEGAASGAVVPRTVLWSQPPANLTPRWQLGSQVRLIELDSVGQGLAYLQDLPSAGSVAGTMTGTLTDNLIGGQVAGVLLLVGDQLPGDSDAEQAGLATALNDVTAHCLIAGGKQTVQQARAWSHPSVQVLSQSEQIVACEAYDFKRWTGCPVASHVWRDAYDEYNGFE